MSFNLKFQFSKILLVAHGSRRKANPRRGSATVFSVFLLSGLLVVSAVAVDYGHINASRSETKRTADAAAMAACWELFDEVVAGNSGSSANQEIACVASQFASQNSISSRAPSLTNADVEIGHWDPTNPGTIDSYDADAFNAVRVHVRQTEANQSAIPLFFGAVTGRPTQSLQTRSTAAMFKNISGFYSPPSDSETLDILPIALDIDTWNDVVAKQTDDNYAFSNGSVQSGSDGFYECSLYPTGTGSPGNRGTVDIGSSNNSTSDLRRQILHGISRQDLVDLGHPLDFNQCQETLLNGDTGLSAGIKAQLAEIIGQTRIIPIFSQVQGNGNNAMYTIVRWEGIRILSVRLTGPMKKKHLTIQPAPMIAKYSRFQDESVQESDFLFTPVMLVE